jgi:hypothetical protein
LPAPLVIRVGRDLPVPVGHRLDLVVECVREEAVGDAEPTSFLTLFTASYVMERPYVSGYVIETMFPTLSYE